MTIIGITGGIGSGKSTLSRLLETFGIPVYIADTEAKKLMNTSPDIKRRLIQKFGEAIYSEGNLNRKKLASLIFCNPEAVSYVNSVVHPAVQSDFINWTKSGFYPVVAVESAILFESGFNSLVDFTVTVSAALEIRIKRISERDHLSKKEITDRIANQIPEEERISRSDFVIINDDYHALIPQIESLIEANRFS
jgi:dephospho-CoA kinase